MAEKRVIDRAEVEGFLADPSFTPGKAHVAPLLDVVALGDDATAKRAMAALARVQSDLGPALARRFAAASAEEQRALARLAGRLATSTVHTGTIDILASALASEDARVRRAAANALGRARGDASEALLLAALEREDDATVRPRIVEALGKVSSGAALPALRAELARGEAAPADAFTRERAALMASRSALRTEPSRVLADRSDLGPLVLAARCREGLEEILASELDAAGFTHVTVAYRPFGPGLVEATSKAALSAVFRARTFLSVGIALPPFALGAEDDLASALVGAITSTRTLGLLRGLTQGPIRYRIAFASGGKRRRAIWDVALEVSKLAPDLVNDATDAVWEILVREAPRERTARIELVPALVDPRFVHRVADVPAASHPTIAAALVRVAGIRPDDVVWDPFVGSGGELCERGLAGRARALVGTDIDPRAIEAARLNLESARFAADLHVADALTFVPEETPTAIITNPPMGRRVLHGSDVGPMLARFVRHAAELLAPGGRLVWISPTPNSTRDAADGAGLSLVRATHVDMGGFTAELQHFERRGGSSVRSKSRARRA